MDWNEIFTNTNLDLKLLPLNWNDEAIPLGKSKNLCNQLFGHVVPMYRINKSRGRCSFWKCYCLKDNTIFEACSEDLIKGHTQSCGCLKKEKAKNQIKNIKKHNKDYTGMKWNHLTAVKFDHMEKNYSYWAFSCDCGNPELLITKASYVYSGDRTRCNKCSGWLGPEKIAKILDENNIKYEQEKTFDGLIYEGKLRFDFWVNNEYAIEYNGSQHYKESSGYFKNKLNLYQERDKAKKE